MAQSGLCVCLAPGISFHRHLSSASPCVQGTEGVKVNHREFLLLRGWEKAGLTLEGGLCKNAERRLSPWRPQGQCKSACNWMRETRPGRGQTWVVAREEEGLWKKAGWGACVRERMWRPAGSPANLLAGYLSLPHTCLNPSSSCLCSLGDWPLLLPWSIAPGCVLFSPAWICSQPLSPTLPSPSATSEGPSWSPLLCRLSCSRLWAEESCWSRHCQLRPLSSFTAASCFLSHHFGVPHVLASSHSRFRLQSAKDRLPESPPLPQSLQVHLALTVTTQPSWTCPCPRPSHPVPGMVTIITVTRGSDCHELSKYMCTVFDLLTPKRGVGVLKGIFNQWKSQREPGVMKTLRSSTFCMNGTSFGLWSAEPSGVFEWTSTDKPEAPKSFLSFPSRTEAACPSLQTVHSVCLF